jgi:hypothetical protein
LLIVDFPMTRRYPSEITDNSRGDLTSAADDVAMTHIDEATNPPHANERTVPRDRVVVYCLAIVGIATAVIHFAVAGAHFQEYWLFGVFMLVAAWLQLLWAIVAIARPSRLLLWSGALLNAGVVAVYVVTRTIGDVIGPSWPRRRPPETSRCPIRLCRCRG